MSRHFYYEWTTTASPPEAERLAGARTQIPRSEPGPFGEDLQTYLSVPLVNGNGDIEGTLCGASTQRVELGPEAVQVMERCARILSQGIAGQRVPAHSGTLRPR